MIIGAVILAAGLSRRFGGSKLLADVGGQTMIERALMLLKETDCERLAVVAADERILAMAHRYGAETIVNAHPQRGQAYSIVLGVQAMRETDAVLLMCADQILLTRETMETLIRTFREERPLCACLEDETHAGSPAVFDRQCFPLLAALTGDCGAKRVLAAAGPKLRRVRCLKSNELADADTPEGLAALCAEGGVTLGNG